MIPSPSVLSAMPLSRCSSISPFIQPCSSTDAGLWLSFHTLSWSRLPGLFCVRVFGLELLRILVQPRQILWQGRDLEGTPYTSFFERNLPTGRVITEISPTPRTLTGLVYQDAAFWGTHEPNQRALFARLATSYAGPLGSLSCHVDLAVLLVVILIPVLAARALVALAGDNPPQSLVKHKAAISAALAFVGLAIRVFFLVVVKVRQVLF
jgi:hypothetical protein